jgi:hypothetical protein
MPLPESPETALWLAVLQKAMEDAVYEQDVLGPEVRWFDGPACRDICGVLGIDREYLKGRMLRVRNTNEARAYRAAMAIYSKRKNKGAVAKLPKAPSWCRLQSRADIAA